MKFTTLTILLISLLLVSCDPSTTIVELESKYETALAYNDTDTAIKYLHDIINLEPNNTSAYNRLSNLYITTKNYKGALIAAHKASKKAKPQELKEILTNKVEAYKKTEQLENAIAVLDSLETIHPENTIKYSFEKGTLFYKSKKYDKVIPIMNSIIKNPQSKEYTKTVNSNFGKETVSYKNAALNFAGAFYMTNNKLDSASLYFKEILNETQSFKLANNNYIQLTQKILASR